MATHAPFTHRLLLTGGFAVAVAAAPIVAALSGAVQQPSSTPLADCPPGQSLDVLSDSCKPDSEVPGPIENPINPENEQLQTGSITGSQPGEVGRLPEVNGIPCNGGNTGLCIGLTEINESLGAQNNYENPFGN